MKPTLCIDFDGTLHKYSEGWKDGSIYDEPIDGSKEFVDSVRNDFNIVIFTARMINSKNPKNTKKKIIEWLDKHKIHYDDITGYKISAIAYIDDRAIEFKGDWDIVKDKVENMDESTKEELEISSWNEIDNVKKRLIELHEKSKIGKYLLD